MSLGPAMHRTSLEVSNGSAIDASQQRYRDRQDAEQGSDALLSAMRLQFRHLALKHGLTMKDARLFLMNAETPHGR